MTALVLKQKVRHKIYIGDDIKIKLLVCKEGWVRMSIIAPSHMNISTNQRGFSKY